jgi:hypothetical protein
MLAKQVLQCLSQTSSSFIPYIKVTIKNKLLFQLFILYDILNTSVLLNIVLDVIAYNSMVKLSVDLVIQFFPL